MPANGLRVYSNLSAGKGNKHVIQNNDEITLPTLENAGIISHKKIL